MTAVDDITPVLVPAVRRARSLDPVTKLLAMADQVGIKFRWEGRKLRVAGLAGLHPDDRQLLRDHADEIKARLAAADDSTDPCEEWGVEVRLVTGEADARAVVASLPASVGLDIETAGRPGYVAADQPWVLITRQGMPYKDQPKSNDKIGLDPFRSEPRTLQAFDPDARIVYVVDLKAVPLEALADLWQRRLVAHNAAFEIAALGALGIHPPDVLDTMQMVGLHLGCARGVRKLENVAFVVLNTAMPKGQQASAWSASQLSLEQVRYAAADAAAAYLAGKQIWPKLSAQERDVFWLQNAVVPIAAAMELAGVGFDAAVHHTRITAWELALADARREFVALTGEDIPKVGTAVRRAWLEARLPESEADTWPRTAAGYLSTKADDLARLADFPEIGALLKVDAEDKKLRDFGRKLLNMINPVTGKIHPSWMPCGAKTGRFTCSNPNLQQIPKNERLAFIALPGRLLVIVDYSKIELRIVAELAQELTMRAVFASGGDLHQQNAALIAGCSEEQVTEAMRRKAKAVSFGTLYGQGKRGLVQTAWNDWRLILPPEEAEKTRETFFARYPELKEWQRENASRARQAGCVRTIKGRPLYRGWEPFDRLRWTQLCNFPVQGSAADLMLDAMARVARAIAGHDAKLIMQVHDELVVECAEDIAAEIAALMTEHMTAAWVELFPDAPSLGIVDVRVSPVWAKSKE